VSQEELCELCQQRTTSGLKIKVLRFLAVLANQFNEIFPVIVGVDELADGSFVGQEKP